MRDIIRAYTSVCMRLNDSGEIIPMNKVKEIVSYTARKFCESHEDSPLSMIKKIDKKLATQLLSYIEKMMWLRI